MERADLLKLFQKWATEIAEKDFSNIKEESVISDLGIDSLGMLELIGCLERELKIQIPDEKLVGIQTVKQLLELVDERVELSNAS
ncbi:MAG: acyl carrier protein [Myxococcales bacterium]|nr:MAG: acyl carrier protein [Myxococcales bacterium]